METAKPRIRILKILLKDFTVKPTITGLATQLGMSRVGIWKILKNLEGEKLIILSPIGAGKTSAYIINLDWDNPLTAKTLALALAQEAMDNQRWMVNFADLEDKVDFLILYGGILHSPKAANDIDIFGVANKNKFLEIEAAVRKTQKTQMKSVHSTFLTRQELSDELKKPNKVFIDALKKGIILFGQENFINFIMDIRAR